MFPVSYFSGGRRRLRPWQAVFTLGLLFATLIGASWIVAGVENARDAHPISRAVFSYIPVPLQAAFYTTMVAVIASAGWLFAVRVRNWERGAPEDRKTTNENKKRRRRNLRRALLMQSVMRDPAAGIMHSLIYFSFLVLFGVTTVLEIDHLLPSGMQFLHGAVYEGYKFAGDTAGLTFLIGIGWAFGRRYVRKHDRLRMKTRPEDGFNLTLLFAIGLTGILVQASRVALSGRPSFEAWGYLGWLLSWAFNGLSKGAFTEVHTGLWVAHVAMFAILVIVIPTTKLRHMVTSPANMYLADRDRPKGAMRAMPDLATTELESFGANAVEDFTWKQLLDTDSCTICGRCTQVCPAHATGKPLDPREIVTKIGNVMAATASPSPTSPVIGYDQSITIKADSVFEMITPEEVWACTSCRACDEVCPVNIEILDKILDMRRYLSLMESNFSPSIGNMYRSLENQENPWGLASDQRKEWITGVDLGDGEIPVAKPSEALGHEYLYWVGCAGAFDDKNKKVTRAVAKLLTMAGVDFAVLGPAERCTGDPARRSGNEYLFQMLAGANVEMLDQMNVTKIITQCPHCFNTMANEYPQLGGRYEVIHHSQLLADLISSGKLDVSKARLDERIVYHDSCYLGRHNDVYEPPRRVLGSLAGIDIVEAPRNGSNGRCCGAGGAHMWMEEHEGEKINFARSKELLATGAQRIATACPFCYIMIDDGTKAAQRDDVTVGDIALHLLDALETD